MQNALVSALEVIDSDRFSFVQNPASLNPERFVPTMMQSEYITSLYVYDLQEGRSERYFKDNASETCVVGEERMNSIFEGGMALDIRPEKWFALLEGNSTEYVCKYAYGYQIPLLKLSEMYLIAAEASGNISYVDSVRVNRGYVTSPLPAGADLLFIPSGVPTLLARPAAGLLRVSLSSYMPPVAGAWRLGLRLRVSVL